MRELRVSNNELTQDHKAEVHSTSMQNVVPDKLNAGEQLKALTKLKEDLNSANANLFELKDKYESINKTLEDLGEISSRELAEYVFEPFDFHLAQLNASEYEAFEVFFRSKDASIEAINYEALINDFIAKQTGADTDLLHKVDCRFKECKVFLFSSDYETVTNATSGIREQPWARGLITNGFKMYTYENDEEDSTGVMFSYLLTDVSETDTND